MPKWIVTVTACQTIEADTEEEAKELPDIYMPDIIGIEAELIDE
tara:strand:- start:7 stop:138 length:132 start_codon:yes stop_codon:yes gene_type:complete